MDDEVIEFLRQVRNSAKGETQSKNVGVFGQQYTLVGERKQKEGILGAITGGRVKTMEIDVLANSEQVATETIKTLPGKRIGEYLLKKWAKEVRMAIWDEHNRRMG